MFLHSIIIVSFLKIVSAFYLDDTFHQCIEPKSSEAPVIISTQAASTTEDTTTSATTPTTTTTSTPSTTTSQQCSECGTFYTSTCILPTEPCDTIDQVTLTNTAVLISDTSSCKKYTATLTCRSVRPYIIANTTSGIQTAQNSIVVTCSESGDSAGVWQNFATLNAGVVTDVIALTCQGYL